MNTILTVVNHLQRLVDTHESQMITRLHEKNFMMQNIEEVSVKSAWMIDEAVKLHNDEADVLVYDVEELLNVKLIFENSFMQITTHEIDSSEVTKIVSFWSLIDHVDYDDFAQVFQYEAQWEESNWVFMMNDHLFLISFELIFNEIRVTISFNNIQIHILNWFQFRVEIFHDHDEVKRSCKNMFADDLYNRFSENIVSWKI